MHDIGALVVCTSLSPMNPEGLILGEDYTVKGRSSHEGNMIYSLEDSEGQMFYSIDRFKTIKGGKKSMDATAKVFEVLVTGEGRNTKLTVKLGDIFEEVGIVPEDIFGEEENQVLEILTLKTIEALMKKVIGA